MIRPARPADVDTILSLIKELAAFEREPDAVQATPDDLRAALFCDRPAVSCLIAEHDTGDGVEIAGFALWFLNFSTWVGKHGVYLEDLYVRPRYRRNGYGKALLLQLVRIALERGYGRVEWSVLDWNAGAQGFYRAIGAVPMDEWTVWRLAGDQLAAAAARVAADSAGNVGNTGRAAS
ncbi:MAG TPA: GNAT family N-acetyltransferase [Acidothermaceae bacterium]|jgi:GNAT superfamily N-acetyltransferase